VIIFTARSLYTGEEQGDGLTS